MLSVCCYMVLETRSCYVAQADPEHTGTLPSKCCTGLQHHEGLFCLLSFCERGSLAQMDLELCVAKDLEFLMHLPPTRCHDDRFALPPSVGIGDGSQGLLHGRHTNCIPRPLVSTLIIALLWFRGNYQKNIPRPSQIQPNLTQSVRILTARSRMIQCNY